MAGENSARVLRFAYEQVLDATKHQDDKVNRLLTAIAFLTGGALAVAALGGAEFLTRSYVLGAVEVPLALITVGVFFAGVVATVLMLVGSLTTPLRLPSVPKSGRTDAPGPPARKDRVWASQQAQRSPVYFFEIAGLSLGQWQTKWDAPDEEIVAEERDALVRETHNLAVRTEFKYTRTGEAVAVLSFALASLATAAMLVLVAAAYAVGPVPFEVPARTAVAIVVGGYVWLQIRISLRHRIQSVEELHWVYGGSRWRARVRVAFPIMSASVPALLIAVPTQHWAWSLTMAALAFVPFALFWRIREDERGDGESARGDRPLLAAAALALVYASICWVSAETAHPEIRPIAGYATTLVLLVAAFVASGGRTRERLRDFQESTSPRAGSQAADVDEGSAEAPG